VQHYFEVSLEPGIIGCLKEKECKPYYYLRRVRELYIMTSGGIAENPVELLSHPKMRKLIEDLRKEFDTIVLDSPPFEPISDARIISGLADGMVMVIRRGKTPHRSVESALKQVDPKKLLGVVFNDAKSVKFHSYHTYGYYGRRDHYSMRHNGYSYPARGEKHRNWIR
jgi:Mrp family chromosome partitioning ATPase